MQGIAETLLGVEQHSAAGDVFKRRQSRRENAGRRGPIDQGAPLMQLPSERESPTLEQSDALVEMGLARRGLKRDRSVETGDGIVEAQHIGERAGGLRGGHRADAQAPGSVPGAHDRVRFRTAAANSVMV